MGRRSCNDHPWKYERITGRRDASLDRPSNVKPPDRFHMINLTPNRSSLVALNATLASQRPIVEQVRRDTLSICQSHSNVSQLFRSKAESDIYSIFNSTIGDEEFSFDEEIVNSQAYRRVMKHWASKDKTTPGDYKQPRTHVLDEPLIDLSWPSLA